MEDFAATRGLQDNRSSQLARLTTNLSEMVEQVSKLIDNLIGSISFLYESHGVEFPVNNKHDTLMRLLTPLELLSYFHVNDNQQYLTEKLLQKSQIPGSQSDGGNQNAMIRLAYDYELTNILSGNVDFKTLQAEIINQGPKHLSGLPHDETKLGDSLKRVKDYMQVDGPQKWKYLEVRRQGMKPILGAAGERQLCQWTYEKLKNDERILLKDIAKQAKIIGKNIRGFGASISWVHRFFDRYPDLYELYKQTRRQQPRTLEQSKNREETELQQSKMDEQMTESKVSKPIKLEKQGGNGVIFEEDEDEDEKQLFYPKSMPKQSAKRKAIHICQPLKKGDHD